MLAALARVRAEYKIEAVQVEYTMLAPYAGDVLVEHDVTFALYRQIRDRSPGIAQRWDYFRWRRFENKWIARYRKVVVMSEQDRALLNRPNVTVVPNGVDLARFTPEMERPGEGLLFIGSFRHFPNIVAYRFFLEQVWPILRKHSTQITFTVVAGPDPLLYWREHTGLSSIPEDDRIRLLEFVSDVRPLYVEANLAIVPTLVSAGTNLKVLEAMAMDRAVVSTSSGCAGLGLEHSVNVWIADQPEDFAHAIQTLLEDHTLRRRIAERRPPPRGAKLRLASNWSAPACAASGLNAAPRADSSGPGERLAGAGRDPAYLSRILAMASPGLSGLRLPDRPSRSDALPDSWFPVRWPIRNVRF